jgi:hypothetical protein
MPEGDPIVTAMDGSKFSFVGVPHKLHRMYRCGQIEEAERLTPVGWSEEKGDPEDASRQYVSGADFKIGDVKIVVGVDGKVHIIVGPAIKPDYHWVIEMKVDTLDAPGHPGCTTLEPHPLQGVAHLNVTLPIFPTQRLAESGIRSDGPKSNDHPEVYLVPG